MMAVTPPSELAVQLLPPVSSLLAVASQGDQPLPAADANK